MKAKTEVRKLFRHGAEWQISEDNVAKLSRYSIRSQETTKQSQNAFNICTMQPNIVKNSLTFQLEPNNEIPATFAMTIWKGRLSVKLSASCQFVWTTDSLNKQPKCEAVCQLSVANALDNWQCEKAALVCQFAWGLTI